MGTSLLKLTYESPVHAHLAEHLLMFDTVGLYCAAGHVIAQHVSRLRDAIGTEMLEQLIASGALVLVPFEATPCVISTFNDLFRNLPKELGADALDIDEGTVCALFKSGDEFDELFEHNTKSFLSQEFIDKLLTTAQWFRPDYRRIVDVSREDMKDRTIRRLAAPTSVTKKGESFPGQAHSRALQRLVWANTQMVVANRGYYVTGGWGDRGIITGKLERVFARDKGEIASETLRELLDVTSIPDISMLVKQGAVSFSEIVKLREGEGQAFRAWFQRQTDNSSATPHEVVQEFVSCLLAGKRAKPFKRRLTGFSISQIAGLIHPLLGLGVSAAVEFGPSLLSKPSPYALFDSLKTYLGEEMTPRR